MKLFKTRDDDLVRLAVFQQPLDAHSLRILLDANGIKASVTGEESNATFGAVGLGDAGLVGVQVLVKRSDFDEATIIMNEIPAASDAIIPNWKCACGEDVDEGFGVCWSCGGNYPDDDDQ